TCRGCTPSTSIRWSSRWRRWAAASAACRSRCRTTRGERSRRRRSNPTARPVRVREWTVNVRSLPDQTLLATLQGARRMFFLITVAAVASLLALVLTVRADRASAALASMKSDFVAAVTHELKTPVAFIRLVGDTLANGRYTSPKTVQEYAGLLSVEAT